VTEPPEPPELPELTELPEPPARRPSRRQVLLRLDPAVHDAIAKWAADELRSTNAQIDYLLRVALADSGRLPSSASPPPRRGRPPRPRDTPPPPAPWPASRFSGPPRHPAERARGVSRPAPVLAVAGSADRGRSMLAQWSAVPGGTTHSAGWPVREAIMSKSPS
jgi:hypothetical protein